MSRGLSNRNPGNIRQSAVRYKGEVRPSRDPAFKQFESMPWGYRAIFVLLDTYRIRHGLETIRGMSKSKAKAVAEDGVMEKVGTATIVLNTKTDEVLSFSMK